MKIIMISREFGSGGRELGKRLADIFDFDYYDSEIISAIAKGSGVDNHCLKGRLDDHGWRSFPITFSETIDSPGRMSLNGVDLLLTQRKVIEEIAALGKNCVIVGRNADVILERYHPLNIFVCAEMEAKVKRCMERIPEGERLNEQDLIREMSRIDKSRARTREHMTCSAWGQRNAYHLIVNTTGWEIKELAPAVAAYAGCWFRRS